MLSSSRDPAQLSIEADSQWSHMFHHRPQLTVGPAEALAVLRT